MSTPMEAMIYRFRRAPTREALTELAMLCFDLRVDSHEVVRAVDQVERERGWK